MLAVEIVVFGELIEVDDLPDRALKAIEVILSSSLRRPEGFRAPAREAEIAATLKRYETGAL